MVLIWGSLIEMTPFTPCGESTLKSVKKGIIIGNCGSLEIGLCKQCRIKKKPKAFLFEDQCSCGTSIPRGYGYYVDGTKLMCSKCGKVNQKPEVDNNGK